MSNFEFPRENNADALNSKLIQFIDDNRYSAHEMREAYTALLEGKEALREVRKDHLLSQMKSLEARGLALNRIARLIEKKDDSEAPIERFTRYVAELPVSEKEKSILHSIAEKGRTGLLEIYADSELIDGSLVDCMDKSPEMIAQELKQIIEMVRQNIAPEARIAITFEEGLTGSF